MLHSWHHISRSIMASWACWNA